MCSDGVMMFLSVVAGLLCVLAVSLTERKVQGWVTQIIVKKRQRGNWVDHKGEEGMKHFWVTEEY